MKAFWSVSGILLIGGIISGLLGQDIRFRNGTCDHLDGGVGSHSS